MGYLLSHFIIVPHEEDQKCKIRVRNCGCIDLVIFAVHTPYLSIWLKIYWCILCYCLDSHWKMHINDTVNSCQSFHKADRVEQRLWRETTMLLFIAWNQWNNLSERFRESAVRSLHLLSLGIERRRGWEMTIDWESGGRVAQLCLSV